MKILRLARFRNWEGTFDKNVTDRMPLEEKLAYLVAAASRIHEQEKEVSYGILMEIVTLQPRVPARVWQLLAEAADFVGERDRSIDAAWNAEVLIENK